MQNEQPDRRKYVDLREMVTEACKGLLPSVADRIKDIARRAYYLGAAEGLEVGRGQKVDDLVSKTIENCKEMMEASQPGQIATNEIEKQRLHVARSLDRCMRCGEHAPSILPAPPLSMLCNDCHRTLRATDGGAMWFRDMVAQISSKENKNEDSSGDVPAGSGDSR